MQINVETPRLVQKATFVLLSRASSSSNSCCMIYFWNPASVKISAKLITIVIVATIPNASGTNNRARIILVIGEINLAIISVVDDHLAACPIF